ncbi:ERF family protein [Gracilibacillus thailandensis]|uniref:Recombinase n=1 Tax=Gracilibacillus thailandensis TaxID=563735 RepID=A0A6N7QVY3_9BACI|nr:ERF family protein [Gracilibacillus thailandensis]MRI65121.1 recombinase [Gracilibacillus thailandensis]
MAEKNLVQKLLSVQSKLKVPKDQKNNFGNYNYRSAEDILEGVKPLNDEEGLLLTLTDEPVLTGDRYYIKATATITDGNETHSVTAYARESLNKKGMDDSQITGTASSYARKYALNGLYLIDDTKDADTDEYQNQNNQNNSKQTYQTQGKPPNGNLTEKQVKRLFAIANEVNVSAEEVKRVIMRDYNKTEVAQLNKQEYDTVCNNLEALKQGATQ